MRVGQGMESHAQNATNISVHDHVRGCQYTCFSVRPFLPTFRVDFVYEQEMRD